MRSDCGKLESAILALVLAGLAFAAMFYGGLGARGAILCSAGIVGLYFAILGLSGESPFEAAVPCAIVLLLAAALVPSWASRRQSPAVSPPAVRAPDDGGPKMPTWRPTTRGD